MFLGTDFSQT